MASYRQNLKFFSRLATFFNKLGTHTAHRGFKYGILSLGAAPVLFLVHNRSSNTLHDQQTQETHAKPTPTPSSWSNYYCCRCLHPELLSSIATHPSSTSSCCCQNILPPASWKFPAFKSYDGPIAGVWSALAHNFSEVLSGITPSFKFNAAQFTVHATEKTETADSEKGENVSLYLRVIHLAMFISQPLQRYSLVYL